MAIIQRITAWSFSRYNTFRKCPLLAKYKFIAKKKEPSGAAADRGTAIHKLGEDFCLNRIRAVPKEFGDFRKPMLEFRKARAIPELELAFDRQWRAVDWFSPACYARIKIDLLREPTEKDPTVVPVDWKTGKMREEEIDTYSEQTELYALGALLIYNTARRATPQLWFLDQAHTHEVGEYTRDDVPKLIKAWDKKAAPMLAATSFKPKPGNHCRYCHFRKANGGPCEY